MPINLSIILTATAGLFLIGLAYSNYGLVKSSPSKRIFTFGYFIEMGSIFLSEIFNLYGLILTVSLGMKRSNKDFVYQGIFIFIIISTILFFCSFFSTLHFKGFKDELLFQKFIHIKFIKVKRFGIKGFNPLRYGNDHIIFIYGETDRFFK